jgi:putative flippase GtrA
MAPRINHAAVRETAGQLLRFGMATGLSAIISLGLPVLLHELLHVEQKIAVAISQVTVLLMNFVTLRLFVFPGKGSVRGDLMRYFGSAAMFRGIEYLSFLALFELAGLFYLTALVVTLITSTLIKFIWYRFLFGRGATPVA